MADASGPVDFSPEDEDFEFFTDDMESLTKVVQMRLDAKRPLRVCFLDSPADEAGAACAEKSFIDEMLAFVQDNNFESTSIEEADVIVSKEPLEDADRDLAFWDVTDVEPFEGILTYQAMCVARCLDDIVYVQKLEGYTDAHFYTYQK